jgi:hypothetical protein
LRKKIGVKFRSGSDAGVDRLVEWWKEVLDKWGAALSFTYEVFRCKQVEKRRTAGEWFRSRREWCIQLDQLHAACIHLDSCDESIQQALSFTLRAVYASYSEQVDEQIGQMLLTLSAGSKEQLQKALQETKLIHPLPSTVFTEPGYFLWIRFDDVELSKLQAESQLNLFIDEVVGEWTTGGWYIWVTDDSGMRSILLYQTCENISSMIDDEDVHTNLDAKPVSVYAQSVSAMLESDASVAPFVTVSQMVQSPLGICPALATLVVASRTLKERSHRERITIFEHHLLLYWLRLLPPHMGDLLNAWMKLDKSATDDEPILQEMEDILDGFVAANLNVSEAARMLYVHRNTLIHRIERIKQFTGLDIRNFFDAVQLWIALKTK